ncbi:hypothetical protein CYCD_21560 [Tenuifilaceae bacterium CYCD]|nr:hypothetical protein CYCD_21560 [Tenuifilaceae bacterium CYCD]
MLHYANQSINLYDIGTLIQLLGLGLLLSFIGLKKGFIYCIVSHGFYNLIVFLIISLYSNINPIILENDSYTAKIKRISIIQNKPTSNFFRKDSIQLNGSLSEILKYFAQENKDTIFKCEKSIYKYSLQVKIKTNSDTIKKELFNNLMNALRINKTISEERIYVLKIYSDDIYLQKTNTYKTTLNDFCIYLNNKFNKIIRLDSRQENKIIFISIDILSLKSIDDVNKFIELNHNMTIIDSGEKIYVTQLQ